MKKKVVDFMEGYMLSVGYPVGVNPQKQTYEIELDNKIVSLDLKEMAMWINLRKIEKQNIKDENEKTMNQLVEKQVAYFGLTIEDLYEKIKEVKAIRQGYFGVNNNKYCISIGKEVLYPTLTQSIMWKCADASSTIDDIYYNITPEMPLEKFMNEFVGLVVAELIAIR